MLRNSEMIEMENIILDKGTQKDKLHVPAPPPPGRGRGRQPVLAQELMTN